MYIEKQRKWHALPHYVTDTKCDECREDVAQWWKEAKPKNQSLIQCDGVGRSGTCGCRNQISFACDKCKFMSESETLEERE